MWEGRGQEDFFSGTCHSVPSIASNGSSQRQSQNQCAKTPEAKVFARGFSAGGTSVLFKPLAQNLVLSGCDSVRFRALSSVSTAAVANDTRSLFLNFPPLSPALKQGCDSLLTLLSSALICCIPTSLRHWGFQCNGSLCAFLKIKPSLFGYSIPSYSAASRGRGGTVNIIYIYISLYIYLSISLP